MGLEGMGLEKIGLKKSKKKSKKKADGTVVNALDASDSFFGGKVAKR